MPRIGLFRRHRKTDRAAIAMRCRLAVERGGNAERAGSGAVEVAVYDAVVVVDADDWDCLRKPVSGRDLVEALANSPLKDVSLERLSVKSPARDLKL